MAGSDPNFSSADFRSAVRAAMTMGMPVDPAEAVTFVFAEKSTFTSEDPNFHPFDWTSPTKTDVVARRVQVPAAVHFGAGTIQGTVIGEFDTSKVQVTVLDVDYALIKGCSYIEINGVDYQIDAIGPPLGLFDTTTYQFFCTARGG